MSQTKKKGLLASIPPRVRVAIALAIIAILAVLSFFAPPEKDATNVTGDTLPETVTVTHARNSNGNSRGQHVEREPQHAFQQCPDYCHAGRRGGVIFR